MEAQQLYIKITLLALKSATYLSKRRLHELNSGIIQLRQLLSCAVCCQLLIDPFKPKGRRCGHHVCRLCLRGRKRLMPSCAQCNDCSDFKTYEENKMMATQLLCYKTLCVHLLQSSLFAQLSHQRPDIERVYRLDRPSRIKLPDQSTQWFIQEGANYEDMWEAFSTLPELPDMPRAPSSLPAETPPTTAATTPELPYEQHMPDQLSITDIELEAATTGEQAQFEHQLPMMTQMLMPGEQPELSAYLEPSWSDQVDLSGALTLAAYTNSPTYTTYMLPGNEQRMPTIGQVVQIPQQLATATATETATQTTPFEPMTTHKRSHVELVLDGMAAERAELGQTAKIVVPNPTYETRTDMRSQKPTIISSATATQTTAFQPVATYKRSHDEMMLDDMAAEQVEPVVSNPTYETRKNTRNQKPTIISSVQVKPPSNSATVARSAPVVAVNVASAPPAPVSVASAPPAPISVASAPVSTASAVAAPPPVATTAAAAAPVATAAAAAASPVTSTPVKPREARVQSAFRKVKPKDTRLSHICRCGTTSAPGKATCRNSRCTCYVAGKSCVDCKCIGCKNPHKDAPESSDEDELLENPETVTEEPTPAAAAETGGAAATAGAAAEEPTQGAATATAATGMQSGFTLVPLDNLQQTQHPLVLMQNENGQYQGFNIFNGTEPVDPAQLGFQRVPLQSNDGNTSIPQYAYVMPAPVAAENTTETPRTPPQAPPTETRNEQPAKKFKNLDGEETLATGADCSLPNFSPIKSVDQLVSAGATSNAAAGDSPDTAKDRAIFEYFLEEQDL